MRRILLVHQDGHLSGSAISLRNFLAALDTTRFEPHVLLGRAGPAEHLFMPVARSVTVLPLEFFATSPSPAPWTPEYFRNIRALRRSAPMESFLRRFRPELVHVNDKAALSAGRAAAAVGVPVVWHLRSAYAGGASRLQNALSRMIISRCADIAIAISEDEVEGFNHRLPVRVIHNSVSLDEAAKARAVAGETRRALGLADDEFAIGMVGLLNETKGAWDFIRAAGRLRRLRPNLPVRFVIIAPIPGRTPLNWGWRGRLGLIDQTHPMDRLEALARAEGVWENLLLTGRRNDVMHVLAAMDIVSCVYNLMAVGRPALEGMAVARPVVVNAGHSGQSSIVRDGVTGLVVPRGAPDAMAQAFATLADDSATRALMGEAGLRQAQARFDDARNAERISEVYEELLRGAGGKG
jgi:glycosyltransferase involved in cell wall biosynthesis